MDKRAALGSLLGAAAGDMIGLPFENLSAKTVGRLVKLPLEPSLIFGRSLRSDDTEQSFMVARCLIEAGDSPERFARRLGARLRWWFLAGPPGIGWGTIKACSKLWVGVPPRLSGSRSAGNGAAMRSGVIGAVFASDPVRLGQFVSASCQATHREPRALAAALLVACAASVSARLASAPWSAPDALAELERTLALSAPGPREGAWIEAMLDLARQGVAQGWSGREMSARAGSPKGVSGYALHTAPVALICWLRHGRDLRAAITEAVLCGGDTDSVASIVGAIVGAGAGPEACPVSWASLTWELSDPGEQARALAEELDAAFQRGFSYPSLGRQARMAALDLAQAPRNWAMLAVVVYVAFRRLAVAARVGGKGGDGLVK